MLPQIALLGRPNVGKSTLFNRLAGKALALVDDQPGVTRDRREAEVMLSGLHFQIVDTGGIEAVRPGSIGARVRQQSEQALADCTVAVLVVDARAGLQPDDRLLAELVRRSHKPIVLVANKCEGAVLPPGYHEAFALGLGEPIPVSAEHNEGVIDLLDALRPHLPAAEEASAEADDNTEKALALAIVGRPNVGKSTLVNRLLGSERLITGPEAGLTRDPIAITITMAGRRVRLVDTAGLRKRARQTEELEQRSSSETARIIRLAQVVVLVVDASVGLEHQDLHIAAHIETEGRALVVALNKWDLIADPAGRLQEIALQLEDSFSQIRGVVLVPLSAASGQGVAALLPAVLRQEEIWSKRVPTAALNRWLAAMIEAQTPPMVGGRRLRLRYITQVKSRPPTFALWTTRPAELPDSYRRYLLNGLRQEFELLGVPLRLQLRKGDNPYA